MYEEVNLIDHIRRRPAMYIGDLRIKGFYQLIEYLLEATLQNDCRRQKIIFEFYTANRTRIYIENADNQKFLQYIKGQTSSNSSPPTLAIPAVIALSKEATLSVNIGDRLTILSAKESQFKVEVITRQTTEAITIDFTPDLAIFKDLVFDYEYINTFLKQIAFLNPGLKIVSLDKRNRELQKNVYRYPSGIFEPFNLLCSIYTYSRPLFSLAINGSTTAYRYQIAIGYENNFSEQLTKTYANNIATFDGGTLLEGVLDGILQSLKSIAQTKDNKLVFKKSAIRKHFRVWAAVRGEDFSYEGSTKTKLGTSLVRKESRQLVFARLTEYLQQHPEIAKTLLQQYYSITKFPEDNDL